MDISGQSDKIKDIIILDDSSSSLEYPGGKCSENHENDCFNTSGLLKSVEEISECNNNKTVMKLKETSSVDFLKKLSGPQKNLNNGKIEEADLLRLALSSGKPNRGPRNYSSMLTYSKKIVPEMQTIKPDANASLVIKYSAVPDNSLQKSSSKTATKKSELKLEIVSLIGKKKKTNSKVVKCSRPSKKLKTDESPDKLVFLAPLEANVLILPLLTNDMFVIECPSFILPFVYEKPASFSLKDHIEALEKQLKDEGEFEYIKGSETKTAKNEGNSIDLSVNGTGLSSHPTSINKLETPSKTERVPASESYFDNPVGSFLVDIGLNMVEEFLRKGALCKQYKSMTKKEKNSEKFKPINKMVVGVMKDFKAEQRKLKTCEFCNFVSESALVLERHMELPHMAGRLYKCSYCYYESRAIQGYLTHVVMIHGSIARIETALPSYPCDLCPVNFSNKAKYIKHVPGCVAKFLPALNQSPPSDWDTPAKLPKPVLNNKALIAMMKPINANPAILNVQQESTGALPNIVVTPDSQDSPVQINGIVVCEICTAFVKDTNTLVLHMERIHNLKFHAKMLKGRPPLNCSYCQKRFFTGHGLERHLLGEHQFVTGNLLQAADEGFDAGKCPFCDTTYLFKLLSHIENFHGKTLKKVRLSYRCQLCSETFPKYDSFVTHVYAKHASPDKKPSKTKGKSGSQPNNEKSEKNLKMSNGRV